MPAETDNTRDRVIEAAGEIFARKGYDAATVRQICEKAEANLAAVNYYFGDKQRLYIETVKTAHRWRLQQASLPDWSAETTPEIKLADFIRTFMLRLRIGPNDTWHTRLVMRELSNPAAACAEMVQESIRPQFELLQSILRDLLPPGTTDRKRQLTAFSIVGQCMFYHFADPVVQRLIGPEEYASYSADVLASHITEFVLASLKQTSADLSTGAAGPSS